jgi:hypothetical protein
MLLEAKAGSYPPVDPRLMTAEHIIPVGRGGLTIAGNVVAACYECNNARSKFDHQTKRGWKLTIGDDTPSSPFAVLREQLAAEEAQDVRREQVRWLIKSGELP